MPRLKEIVRTLLSTSFLLFLVPLNPVRGQSSGGSGSGNMSFYLVLQRNETNRSCLVMNHTAVCQECQECLIMNDTDISQENQECQRNPGENPQCMCGDKLQSAQNARTSMLKQEYCNISVPDTTNNELGFCGDAFVRLEYIMEFKPVENMTEIRAFNASLIEKLENTFRKFKAVIDRTIVGVYLRSKDQKYACLEAYKQWLCATQLPLYTCNDTNEAIPTKPCLSVCHKVLQRCPYYLPSKFQHSGGGQDREVIYGGYPAFDCPSSADEISYSSHETCIGKKSQATCINSGLSFMGLLMSVLCAILSSGSISS